MCIRDRYQEAKELGLNTRPVVVGPFTFLQLSDFEDGVKAEDFVDSLAAAYQEVLSLIHICCQCDRYGLAQDSNSCSLWKWLDGL